MSCEVVRAVDEGAAFDDPRAMTPRLFGPRTWPHAAALLAAAVATVVGACSEERACYPGDYRGCSCGEASGYELCSASGEEYGACDCTGLIPGLTAASSSGVGGSGGGGSGGSGGSGLLPFLSPCSTDAECETGLCYDFNAQGPHCSKTCTSAAECPSPSTECNGMGVCKLP